MLKLIFQTAGHEVCEAGHGVAALEIIATRGLPDIISTDLMMPVMGGSELIHRLRSEAHTASIPIIVISATLESPDVGRGLGQADAVVRKPFTPADLLAVVRSIEDRMKRT